MLGIDFLVSSSKEIDRILYSDKGRRDYELPLPLDRHPFGLPIPNPLPLREIRFMGYPGATEVSVRTFAAYVADHLTSRPLEIQYLREIFVEFDPNQPKNHDVFFEAMIMSDLMMCGGCTDCSGGGGYGRQQLEGLFAVISTLFSVPVQKVTVPYARGEEGRRFLDREFKEFEISK